ncbi:MAG: Ldh family oxidoreductase [Bacteroidales bacterium]|nr:Ldh family oxidoreductase [Bacteroidales bacterium]MBN2817929.1 Ldh family oxidoreductase [Bacteroidales bacterium]
MYTYDYLFNFTAEVFSKMGCPKDDAEKIAKVFMAAELRGLSSHGMIRIKDYYQLWEAKRINIKPNIKIVFESPSTAVVDGDGAIGMLAATRSMEIAMEKAEKAGTGWVSTRGSNHFGIAGYYAMMALEKEMIGMSMTNANPLVAPMGSVSRMLGTNPIAVAIPAGKHKPYVADFATTPIARGKLAVAEKKGEKVALGYVQDKDGNPTDDPTILKEGGSMLTLGGDYEHGQHKGYCLSTIVDIFSCVFSGANFGPFCPPSVAYLPVLEQKVGEGTGHFFGAMRIDAWQPAELFRTKMDKWIDTFKSAKPAKGVKKVLIPGEPEFEKEEKIKKEGIAVIPAIASDLEEIAKKLNIEFKLSD